MCDPPLLSHATAGALGQHMTLQLQINSTVVLSCPHITGLGHLFIPSLLCCRVMELHCMGSLILLLFGANSRFRKYFSFQTSSFLWIYTVDSRGTSELYFWDWTVMCKDRNAGQKWVMTFFVGLVKDFRYIGLIIVKYQMWVGGSNLNSVSQMV